MNKKEIKTKIESYEYYNNGMKHINGAWVKVLNLKLSKNKVFCDIILGMEDKEERYNNCEYELKVLEGLK